MGKKGFTFAEFLIVVLVMGVLVAITASQFITAKQKANDVSRKGDLNAVSKVLNMYFADYNKMPEVAAIKWGEEFKDDSGYVYMKKLPVENKSTYPPYCYKVGPNGKSYALFARLENTGDSQCVRGMTYDCGGKIDAYCFAYYSVGVSLDNNGNIL